jgi:hypothetical protein
MADLESSASSPTRFDWGKAVVSLTTSARLDEGMSTPSTYKTLSKSDARDHNFNLIGEVVQEIPRVSEDRLEAACLFWEWGMIYGQPAALMRVDSVSQSYNLPP